MKCMVGAQTECGLYVIFLFWGRMVARTALFVLAGLLLRYGEGANYNVIVGVSSNPPPALVKANQIIDTILATVPCLHFYLIDLRF